MGMGPEGLWNQDVGLVIHVDVEVTKKKKNWGRIQVFCNVGKWPIGRKWPQQG